MIKDDAVCSGTEGALSHHYVDNRSFLSTEGSPSRQKLFRPDIVSLIDMILQTRKRSGFTQGDVA